MRLLGLVLLVLPAVGLAYQVDLVPASERPEARDITGQVGIGGASGNVHVSIDNVNDLHGDPLGQATLVVQLRIRVNGLRRRATLPLPVDGGNGSTTDNLGLRAGTGWSSAPFAFAVPITTRSPRRGW